VVAPAVPGDYQLRYYNGDNREVLATRPLRVVAVEVSLDAPASVPMASRITVGWTGPGARFDELQLFDPAAKGGDGRLVDSQRVATDKGAAQKQATVVAPAVPGQYELRYYNGDNRTVLATRPITVTAIEVSLQAPDRAPVDSPITVRWTGPGATFDNIEIHDPAARNGEGQLVVNRRITTDPGYARREATLRTPKVPGTYQLRYYNGDNRAVLATRPLIVE
jgi:Ca-activated chloride channel family protein